ncbi:MAG: DUF1232 domain-containing protein [Candidatus Marinimicrobia bacterium]|nr:DUF1232 domain-containing protein [Candidatus Neomarinimicrobiota bacterium]
MGISGKLKSIHSTLVKSIRMYQGIKNDPRTPRAAKWLLALAVGYILSPIDIVPDFIPVIGHLDDAIVVPMLIFLALKMIPPDVIEEHRQSSNHH